MTRSIAEQQGIRRFVIGASLVLGLALVPACGGGSSGTGTKLVFGSVSSTEGAPVSGLKVTITQTNEEAITDAAGSFALETTAEGDELTFQFEGASGTASAEITNVPADASEISLSFVTQSTGDVSIASVEIDGEEKFPEGGGTSGDNDGSSVCVENCDEPVSDEPPVTDPITPICVDVCGNGECELVVCEATGCPCAESPLTCPLDCADTPPIIDPGFPLCVDQCGDGICPENVCLGTGCPCGETPETCPTDCVSETS